jgi:hypothetical protein
VAEWHRRILQSHVFRDECLSREWRRPTH